MGHYFLPVWIQDLPSDTIGFPIPLCIVNGRGPQETRGLNVGPRAPIRYGCPLYEKTELIGRFFLVQTSTPTGRNNPPWPFSIGGACGFCIPE